MAKKTIPKKYPKSVKEKIYSNRREISVVSIGLIFAWVSALCVVELSSRISAKSFVSEKIEQIEKNVAYLSFENINSPMTSPKENSAENIMNEKRKLDLLKLILDDINLLSLSGAEDPKGTIHAIGQRINEQSEKERALFERRIETENIEFYEWDIRDLNEENIRIESDLATRQNQLERFKKQRDKNDTAIAKLEAELAELNGKREENDTAIAKLSAEFDELINQREANDTAIAKLEAELAELNDMEEANTIVKLSLGADLVELNAELAELNGKREENDTEIAKLEAELAELNGKREENGTAIEELEADLAELNGEREENDTAIEELSVELAKLKARKEINVLRISDLNQSIENSKDQLKRINTLLSGDDEDKPNNPSNPITELLNPITELLNPITELPNPITELQSDMILAIAMTLCGGIGAIFAALRSKDHVFFITIFFGLVAGFITFLVIKGGKSFFLLNVDYMNGPSLNPYAAAFSGILVGLFTDKAYGVLVNLVNRLEADITGGKRTNITGGKIKEKEG